ncbi:MAG TPA: hypothetical protein VFM14_15230 [Gemmatimonadales bacterium]|nr:hypothetical protein [Gemmatimonadales bacterium]
MHSSPLGPRPAGDAGVQYGQDVRMLEPRWEEDLALEALKRRVCGDPGQEDLERDGGGSCRMSRAR